jgi:hypothetical protein
MRITMPVNATVRTLNPEPYQLNDSRLGALIQVRSGRSRAPTSSLPSAGRCLSLTACRCAAALWGRAGRMAQHVDPCTIYADIR